MEFRRVLFRSTSAPKCSIAAVARSIAARNADRPITAMIMDALRQWLSPWYLEIKFVHLAAVMAWLWSTSVAYVHYLLPAFHAWRRNPDDEGVIALRDWVMDRFDRGAVIEHRSEEHTSELQSLMRISYAVFC